MSTLLGHWSVFHLSSPSTFLLSFILFFFWSYNNNSSSSRNRLFHTTHVHTVVISHTNSRIKIHIMHSFQLLFIFILSFWVIHTTTLVTGASVADTSHHSNNNNINHVLQRSSPPGITYRIAQPLLPRDRQGERRQRRRSLPFRAQPIIQKLHKLPSHPTSRPRSTNPRSAAALLGAHRRGFGGSSSGAGYENITSVNAYGTRYAVSILWDGLPFLLHLETGSSDTWVVREDFVCLLDDLSPGKQSDCAFGPPYPLSLPASSNSNASTKYGPVKPQQHMYVSYPSGELASGLMVYSDLYLGGNLTIQKQQTSLVSRTRWMGGDNTTSGLLGLGFPSLGNSFLGPADNLGGGEEEEEEEHDPENRVEYPTLLSSMLNQGRLAAPVFSIAIERNASTGVIVWGGVPTTDMLREGRGSLDMDQMATVDMIIVRLSRYSFFSPLSIAVVSTAGIDVNSLDNGGTEVLIVELIITHGQYIDKPLRARPTVHGLRVLLLHGHPRGVEVWADHQHREAPLHCG